jgi:hypothetical protein
MTGLVLFLVFSFNEIKINLFPSTMAPGGDQGSMGWRHPDTFVLPNQFSFLFFFKLINITFN